MTLEAVADWATVSTFGIAGLAAVVGVVWAWLNRRRRKRLLEAHRRKVETLNELLLSIQKSRTDLQEGTADLERIRMELTQINSVLYAVYMVLTEHSFISISKETPQMPGLRFQWPIRLDENPDGEK